MKIRLIPVLMILATFIVVSSCDPFDSDIKHISPVSPIEDWEVVVRSFSSDFDRDFTASISLFIELNEQADLRDVKEVSVIDPTGARWRFDKDILDLTWNESRNEFNFWNLYYIDMPNEIRIGTWEYTIVFQDVEFTYNFEISALSSNYSSGPTIRSSTGTESDSEIIGRATITDSTPAAKISKEGMLNFNYQVNDSFAKTLWVYLYNSKNEFVDYGQSDPVSTSYDKSLTRRTDPEDIVRVDRIRLETYTRVERDDGHNVFYANLSYLITDVGNNFTAPPGSPAPSSDALESMTYRQSFDQTSGFSSFAARK
jgi:hypothetical protein